jgi:hypothetical protein
MLPIQIPEPRFANSFILATLFTLADLPFSYRELPQICRRRVVPIPPNILSPV